MGPVDSAIELLRRTESELRKLLGEAAITGDYGSVVQIAAWARSISELAAGHSSAARVTSSMTDATRLKVSRVSTSKKPDSRRKAGGEDYPRFFRQGDRLVRVSWSKRERKEYEHKAPLSVLKLLADRIAAKGVDGRVFATDELTPVADNDGVEVPTYQMYAGLALLKQVGLVDQHGRQGYSVPRLAEFKVAVDALCQNLPEK
jgi:hypothetical protein